MEGERCVRCVPVLHLLLLLLSWFELRLFSSDIIWNSVAQNFSMRATWPSHLPVFNYTGSLQNSCLFYFGFMIQGEKRSSPGTHPSRAPPYFALQRPELHLDGCRRCARLMVGSSGCMGPGMMKLKPETKIMTSTNRDMPICSEDVGRCQVSGRC